MIFRLKSLKRRAVMPEVSYCITEPLTAHPLVTKRVSERIRETEGVRDCCTARLNFRVAY